jgi:DNA-binding response OmpR family regulator
VIILDVMLPGLDGYQVCARLREQGLWTPIMMLTAMDDLDQVEGLDVGADDYLAKPFACPVLLAWVRGKAGGAYRRRPRPAPGSPHRHT